jgi:hypothetical protein
MVSPGIGYDKGRERGGEVKSYWFRTLAHPSYTSIHSLLYQKEGNDSAASDSCLPLTLTSASAALNLQGAAYSTSLLTTVTRKGYPLPFHFAPCKFKAAYPGGIKGQSKTGAGVRVSQLRG